MLVVDSSWDESYSAELLLSFCNVAEEKIIALGGLLAALQFFVVNFWYRRILQYLRLLVVFRLKNYKIYFSKERHQNLDLLQSNIRMHPKLKKKSFNFKENIFTNAERREGRREAYFEARCMFREAHLLAGAYEYTYLTCICKHIFTNT